MDNMLSPLGLVWLHSIGQADGERLGPEKRNTIPPDHVYTSWTRGQLASLDLAPFNGLTDKTAASTWHRKCDFIHRKTLALACVRGKFSPDMATLLSDPNQAQYDFWQRTRYAHEPLLFSEIIRVVRLKEPQTIFSYENLGVSKGWCFNLTVSSSQRLWHAETATGQSMWEVVAQWSAEVNQGRPIEIADRLLAVGAGPSLSIKMSAPHCLLASYGIMKCVSLPWPTDRRVRAGMRLDLAKPVFGAVEPKHGHRPPAGSVDPEQAFTPQVLINIADALRAALAGNDLRNEKEELMPLLEVLVGAREGMFDALAQTTKKSYDMELLINCLMCSGYLRAAAGLHDSLRFGLRAVVPEPRSRYFFEQLLNTSHSLPKRSTLIDHRLTLQCAFYLHMQLKMKEFLERGGGVTRFGTADGSPQAGLSWEICGFITVPNAELLELRDDAHFLIITNLQPEVDAEFKEMQTEVSERLAAKLILVQNPPGATGSGASSLWHKVHTIVHTTRLVSPSWKATVALVNSVLTWTGDLGTEAGLAGFGRVHLHDLMGDWVLKDSAPWLGRGGGGQSGGGESGGAGGSGGLGGAGGDHAFDIQAEDGDVPVDASLFDEGESAAPDAQAEAERMMSFNVVADDNEPSFDASLFDVQADTGHDQLVQHVDPTTVDDYNVSSEDSLFIDMRRSLYIHHWRQVGNESRVMYTKAIAEGSVPSSSEKRLLWRWAETCRLWCTGLAPHHSQDQ